VTINSNDANEPEIEILLTGAGIPDYLEVMPQEDFTFSGHPGGPFLPSTTTYQLTNNGPVNIDWIADPNVPWLDVAPTAGTLKPALSATVTVTPNSQADTLPEGNHQGNMVFVNDTTSVEHIRKVTLNVYTEPKVWLNPQSFSVTLPQGGALTELLTIGNSGDRILNFSLSSRQISFTPSPTQKSAGVLGKLRSPVNTENFTADASTPYAADELLVRFAPAKDVQGAIDTDRKISILQSLGGASLQREYDIVEGLCLIKLPAGMTLAQALIEFNQSDAILYAQPNYQLHALATLPNDPMFDNLWGMHNIGQTGGTVDADIDAPEAWDIATGSADIIVAVIDTGIDYTHPDLAANMWINQAEFDGTPGFDDDGNGYVDDIYGYDFCNYDGDPWDDHYHGTHCAGTIGAIGDNGQGVTGICWNVKLMAVKFLDAAGDGWTSDAINAVEYSMQMGAKLSSNSWGGGDYNQALKDAINAAGAAGMLFVAAAGNDYGLNNDIYPHYPSSYDCESIVAVLSTDDEDDMSYFSNYGFASVDLGAPGTNILSCEPSNQYQYLNGTSMATPHVAGACSLLWSINPWLSNEEVKNIILDTVDETLPGLCVSQGRLNLYRTLEQTSTSWLNFIPESGTVAPGTTEDVTLEFLAEMPPGIYQGEIIVACDDPYTPQTTIGVSMTVNVPDSCTELFDPNGNDMSNQTLTFKPNALVGGYEVCRNEVADFPVDPTGSTIVTLGDDDYLSVDLLGPRIEFYDNSYDTFYIGSNGYVTFVSGDTFYLESFDDHFDLPRISALFDDLDPSAAGTISFKQLNDRVVVTFQDVPEYSSAGSNSFQIEIYFNGKIRITLLDIAAQDGLIGLSAGNGVPAYFGESDFSAYDLCLILGDINGDLNINLTDFALLGGHWQKQYVEPPTTVTARDEFNAVSYNGNDGTDNWLGPWQEIGESDGPDKGKVQVASAQESYALLLDRKADMHGTARAVDLSIATFATLTFNWNYDGLYTDNNTTVDVSSDAGATWTTILNIPDGDGSDPHSENLDISSYIADATRIRFVANNKGKGKIYFDNIQIEHDGFEPEPWPGQCDLNNDLEINAGDLLILSQHWQE